MTTTAMASAISTPKYSCSSSFTSRHPTLCALSPCIKSYPKTQIISFPKWIPQLGLSPFSPWNGLRHLGISISRQPVKIERKRQYKGKGVYASLFGVGAPEVLVIGVVALLVFGPKGLAEVARNLGKTLRAFQPTIKELQEVSREFKSTLEREIGLDEIQSPNSMQNTTSSKTTSTISTPSSIANPEDSQMVVDRNGAPSPEKAYSSEDNLKITEEQLKASAAQQPTQTSSLGESQSELQTQPQDAVQEAAATTMPPSLEKAYSSEDYLKITEEQLKASAAQQPTQTSSLGESQSELQTQPQDAVQEAAATMPPSPEKAYSSEDYLKITEEQLKASAAQQPAQTSSLGESQSEPQTRPQDAVQETAATMQPEA